MQVGDRDMGDNPKIEWLKRYLSLQRQVDNREDTLARLENSQYLPAMPQSEGSKHTPGRSDRMANATVRYMEQKQKLTPIILACKEKMRAIEIAVYAIDDPLEQEVLILRYLEGAEGYRLMKWRDVAIAMYHSDDEADLTRVYRLHGAALLSLKMEDNATDGHSGGIDPDC